MLLPKQELVERVHEHLLLRLGGMPGVLQPGVLASAVERPKTVVAGHEMFKGTIAKAVALGYPIISWHPFADGNKRTGINIIKMTLYANNIDMVLPPYIVKYCVRAALEPTEKRHLTEEQFLQRIMVFCSDTTLGQIWRNFRYDTIPTRLFEGYQQLLRWFPESQIINAAMERRVLDWYAAGDRQTLAKTIQEWQTRTAQGYPRKVPKLKVSRKDDFIQA